MKMSNNYFQNKIYNETFVKQMWSFINLLINELRMSRATINEQKASLNILVKSEGFSMNTRYVELKSKPPLKKTKYSDA